MSQMGLKVEKTRFVTLDILRGYLVLVIIIDHLNRSPLLFAWITGQGRLWISAGEGFFIISGLLVGYTRGYKKLTTPMKQVTALLYKRAFVLYVSAVVASAILLLITLHSSFPPALQPSVVVPGGSITTALYQLLTLQFVFEWVYFLKLYVASMLLAPLFIWILRKKQTAIAAGLAILIWFVGYHIEQDWLQWQILFFLPAIFGFHLESIRGYWRTLATNTRKRIEIALVTLTAISLAISSFWVFAWQYVKRPDAIISFEEYVAIREVIDPYFYKVQLSIGRILLSFICFAGLYIVFNKSHRYIGKYAEWLLLPFGKSSLTAYIIHSFLVLPLQVLVPVTSSSLVNTLLATCLVLAVFGLMKLPIIRKIIPS